MKCLEIIRVRSASERREQVNWTLHNLAGHIQKVPGLLSARVCADAKVSGDWGLFLLWENQELGRQGSTLALRLAQDLRALGLVDHTVWVDQQP